MSSYVIGDVQGCYQELQQLLALIDFQPLQDHLYFVGDLVSRGPDSLAVLRFIKALPHTTVVLGNHDLHLLCVGYGVALPHGHDFGAIIAAQDKNDLLDWLRIQPILHIESAQNFAMVHAGIPPQWNLPQAKQYADELSAALQANDFIAYLQHMFGHDPTAWAETLRGYDRLRYITNAFTRMRFCTQTGKLDLDNKTNQHADPTHYQPWFDWVDRCCDIVFGHWAALQGQCTPPHYYAIDTGCVWGGSLTALRISDKRRFSVAAHLANQ